MVHQDLKRYLLALTLALAMWGQQHHGSWTRRCYPRKCEFIHSEKMFTSDASHNMLVWKHGRRSPHNLKSVMCKSVKGCFCWQSPISLLNVCVVCGSCLLFVLSADLMVKSVILCYSERPVYPSAFMHAKVCQHFSQSCTLS